MPMTLIDHLKPKKLFKAKVPDLKEFVGKRVLIPGLTEPIKIKKIVGNKFKPTFYEINDEHLIGMLRFHAQMTGAKDITEEEFKAFEEMDLEAERMPEKKTVLEAPSKSK
jgi:hypothetical protein